MVSMAPVRLYRLLFLALALLAAQVGSLAHGVGHHGDQDKPHGACQLCAAYADFEHGATPQIALPTLPESELPSPETPYLALTVQTRLAFRARAPPLLA